MENLINEFKTSGQIFFIKSKNDKRYELEDKQGKIFKITLSVLATYEYTIIEDKIMINNYFLCSNSMICKFEAFMLFLFSQAERFHLTKEIVNEFSCEYETNKYTLSLIKEDFITTILSMIYTKKLIEERKDINFIKLKLELIDMFKGKKEYKIISTLDLLSSIIIRYFSLNTTMQEAYEICKNYTYNKKFFDLEYFIKDILKKNELISKKVPF